MGCGLTPLLDLVVWSHPGNNPTDESLSKHVERRETNKAKSACLSVASGGRHSGVFASALSHATD